MCKNVLIETMYDKGFMSFNALAKASGTCQATVYNWMAGIVLEPNTKAIRAFDKMCVVLGMEKNTVLSHMANNYQWAKDGRLEMPEKPKKDEKNDTKTKLSPCVIKLPDPEEEPKFALRDWMDRTGTGPMALADKVGISLTMINAWADGVVQIPPEWCQTLIDITGLSRRLLMQPYLDRQKEKKQKEAEALDDNVLIEKKPLRELLHEKKPVPIEELEELNRTSSDATDVSECRDEVEVTTSEVREILDMVYAKVTLEEYRRIEQILGKEV